jgi:hypothetical protein
MDVKRTAELSCLHVGSDDGRAATIHDLTGDIGPCRSLSGSRRAEKGSGAKAKNNTSNE